MVYRQGTGSLITIFKYDLIFLKVAWAHHKVKGPASSSYPSLCAPLTLTAGWTAAFASTEYKGLWQGAWDWPFTLNENDMMFKDFPRSVLTRKVVKNEIGTT